MVAEREHFHQRCMCHSGEGEWQQGKEPNPGSQGREVEFSNLKAKVKVMAASPKKWIPQTNLSEEADRCRLQDTRSHGTAASKQNVSKKAAQTNWQLTGKRMQG